MLCAVQASWTAHNIWNLLFGQTFSPPQPLSLGSLTQHNPFHSALFPVLHCLQPSRTLSKPDGVGFPPGQMARYPGVLVRSRLQHQPPSSGPLPWLYCPPGKLVLCPYLDGVLLSSRPLLRWLSWTLCQSHSHSRLLRSPHFSFSFLF